MFPIPLRSSSVSESLQRDDGGSSADDTPLTREPSIRLMIGPDASPRADLTEEPMRGDGPKDPLGGVLWRRSIGGSDSGSGSDSRR